MKQRTVLALDFDGVICASQREVFCTGLQTYALLEPESSVAGRAAAVADLVRVSPAALEDDPLYLAFQPLVPLGNRAEDFGVGLAALDRGVEIDDQAIYDDFFATFDREWLQSYHELFYETRNRQRRQSPDSWLGLHEPYEWFVDLLQSRRNATILAIATAKDGRSVGLLLERFGISDLFPGYLVLDKDTGVHKTEHLRALARRLDVPFEGITFVDDKVNHLETVAPLGVRPVLAGWGYNTSREHNRAREQGFDVATTENAEVVLFGRPTESSKLP